LLLTAIRQEKTAIVELLLHEGVDINDIGYQGYEEPPYWFEAEEYTPFDMYGPSVFEQPIITAIQDNYVEITELLLKHGADINKKGVSGYSGYDLMKDRISSEMKKVLDNYVLKNEKSHSPLQLTLSSPLFQTCAIPKIKDPDSEKHYPVIKIEEACGENFFSGSLGKNNLLNVN